MSGSKEKTIADREADVTVASQSMIGRGYMPYERYEISIARPGEPPLLQQRDMLRAASVVAVLPVDLARQQVVLLHQFRLSAHFATGRGEMVEIVAGRIDDGETRATAARRECEEEIGVTPERMAELFTVLPSPGLTDERVTLFVGFVNASKVPARSGLAGENEDTRPFAVSIDDAISSLERGTAANALLVTALQWLAIHRAELTDYFNRAV
jgi:ADP-ribose pyrophosphatase